LRPDRIEKMTEPVIKTENLAGYHADALELLPTLPAGSAHCIVTDPPYWTLNKWRSIGTTTRLGGHRDADKRMGWFEEIDREQLYSTLCEFARLLPKNGHAWVFADNDVQAIIKGFVEEGETGFNYAKSYPVLKMRGDGLAPRMGMGYHLKATTEFVVLCEKGRRRWSNELNNRPDYFMLPWTGDAETRGLTDDGKPYPTAKPWMLYRQLVQLSSSEGETVLDPFAGSGPLATAALVEKRKAVLIDKSADAIEVIRRRIDPERCRRDLAAIEAELGLPELQRTPADIHGSRDADVRAGLGNLFDVGL
jgi:site-specific DNA-methyltransferase (adenine-specific)